MNPEPAGRRRRLRLTLQATMVLVLVVGGWMGWRVDRARTQREVVAALKLESGGVAYDYAFPGERDGLEWFYRDHHVYEPLEPTGPRWLREAIGDEFFQEVTAVQFHDLPDPSVWPKVAKLDRLADLSFSFTGEISGVSNLRSLRRLKSVEVEYASSITGASLAEIAAIPNLESVQFYCRLTDDSLARIAAIPNLKSVDLQVDRLTDDSLAILSRADKLVSIDITFSPGHPDDGGYQKVTDGGLAHLARLGRLKSLSLDAFGPFTDRSLRELRPILPNLESLELGETTITDAGLAELKIASRLKELPLKSPAITDAGLDALRGLDRLEEIVLDGPILSDAGLARLRTFPALKRFTLYGWTFRMTQTGVDALKAARPGLEIFIGRPGMGGMPVMGPTPAKLPP